MALSLSLVFSAAAASPAAAMSLPIQHAPHASFAAVPTAPACHHEQTLPRRTPFALKSDIKQEFLGAEAHGILRDDGTSMARKWQNVMGRHAVMMQNPKNAQKMNAWLQQFNAYRYSSLRVQAKAVDKIVDDMVTYTADKELNEKSDYWSTPLETIKKRKGDCEDYAILKYFALRYLDVPAERLLFAAVGSEGKELDHAVLLVDVGTGGWPPELMTQDKFITNIFIEPQDTRRLVILDNDGDGGLNPEDTSPYKPYYVMNETGIWSVSAPPAQATFCPDPQNLAKPGAQKPPSI